MTSIDEYRVGDFHSLHDVLGRFPHPKGWLFRGHRDLSWKLLPKVGRSPYVGVNDSEVFEAWKRRAVEYVTIRPETDWDWLAIAQHHGLATRLLDWASNPLAASYFAVEGHSDRDAAVYACRFRVRVNSEIDHPMKYSKVGLFRPRGVVPRRTRQGGQFSVHGEPELPMESQSGDACDLCRIVIDRTYRHRLMSELSSYGVNRATLFPDLDGLSAFVNWTVETKEYFFPS